MLPETGFRFQIAFNTGNTTRQTVGEIWQSELAAINPLYQIETIGLPWPTFLNAFRASQLPISISGWVEDIHDPHNWIQPYTYGTFGGRQGLPDEVRAEYEALASAAVVESDPAVREQMYFDIQQEFYNDTLSAVSYTHLDVYKRQPYPIWWPATMRRSSCDQLGIRN